MHFNIIVLCAHVSHVFPLRQEGNIHFNFIVLSAHVSDVFPLRQESNIIHYTVLI